MITVTIQGSPSEVRTEMLGLLGLSEIPTEAPPSHRQQESDTPKKAAKEEKVSPPKETTKKSSDGDTVPTGKPKTETAKTDEPLTIESVKGIVPKLMVKIGREKVVALLGEFGAKKGSEVQEKDIPSFMAKAVALLA